MADGTRNAAQQARLPPLPSCSNSGNLTVKTIISGLNGGNAIGSDLSAFYNVLISIGLNNGTVKELF